MMGVMKVPQYCPWLVHRLSGYLAFWLLKLWGIDPYLALPLVIIAMFIVGLVLYRLALSPLLKLQNVGARMDLSMLITFGLIYVMDNTMAMLWTPNIRSAVTSYSGESVHFLGAHFSITGLYGLAIAVLTALALYFLLSRTILASTCAPPRRMPRRQSLRRQRPAYLPGFLWHRHRFGRYRWRRHRFELFHQPDRGLSWLLIAFVVMILAGEGNIYGILPAGIIVASSSRSASSPSASPSARRPL
jgi:branched-chain amino acid transport system permease protein